MTDWATDQDGIHRHPWCGAIMAKNSTRDDCPTVWVWVDRTNKLRASFPTLAEAKLAARKFSGVEVR